MFRWKKDQPDDKSGNQTEAPSDGGSPAPADAKKDGDTSEISAPPLKPFTRKGSHTPTKPPAAPSFHPAPPRRTPPDIPGVAPRISERAAIGGQDSKRLVIGRDISISGEVNACDRLLVEGRAEIALPNTDQLEVTHSGFFQGSADVKIADISGRFEGDLIAMGPKPNYASAIKYHREAIQTATPLGSNPRVEVRRMAKRVMIDAHLGVANDIAWGNQ